ncbi:NAD(P)H-binding protein [Actinoplanes sp. LDG1-06]|uniref:NAD(P)H-binding protein n=1 Tax=Paractinoplanes ovalisporus TaxID=2810368 RepID=A0ABS2AG43_9ACTN|nr:NAD(P)H-binding protein [Actinoplanes ovalisporus]MBM2618229.1 NAD(P)H-binding protein [Actinoplanes ovalisporus]
MTIAVTTPTGHVGSRVVQLLVQAGERPRVLVRDPAKLPAELLPLVEVAQGDLLDAGFVSDALKGADALFWASPESFTSPDPLADMVTMGQNAASAVRGSGVPRVLQISSVGAELRGGAGLIDGLARNEEDLAATGTDLLTLRCGYYFTNLLGMLDPLREGVLTTTAPPSRRMPWVDPRDVGEVAAACLLAGWSGSSVGAVHGPSDLTWTEVGEILTAALGRPVSIVQITDEQLREALTGAGLSEAAASGVAGMTSGIPGDFRPEQPRDVRTTTPSTLAGWAYANLRPALSGGTSN